MITKTRVIIGLGILIGLIGLANWICPLIVTFFDAWVFEGGASEELDGGTKVWTSVNAYPKRTAIRIWAKSSLPYSLDIGFYTNTRDTTVRTAIVENVTIEYPDGHRVEVLASSEKLILGLQARRSSNWNGKSIVYNDSFFTHGQLTNCIDRNSALIVHCQGTLIHENRPDSPFSVRWEFHPERIRGFVPTLYMHPDIVNSPYPRP